MAKKLKITQIRSALRRIGNQGLTVRALGITKVHQTVFHSDTPQIRGMINKVRHLVRVEEVEE
jgi:large subunit ribosomal protein L30